MLFCFCGYGGVAALGVIAIVASLVYLGYRSSKKANTIALLRQRNNTLIKDKLEKVEDSFAIEFSVRHIPAILQERILHSDAVGLIEMLDEGIVLSEDLVKFFYMRCRNIGRMLEATTESNIGEAIELARIADRYRKQHGADANKPLLGLPFSVKESIEMKGFDVTQGFPTRIGRPSKDDAEVIKILKEAGGIPFMRTNVPQYLMAHESKNEIFGNSKNPHNHSRTAGGSSGGEAALIASGCSPIGIGSDTGGSIRVPSLFCGLFGFKPTQMRLPVNGHPSLSPIFENSQQSFIAEAIGPLCKSSRDVEIIMRIYTEGSLKSRRNLMNPTLAWRKDHLILNKKKIKIGYFFDLDGVLNSSSETAQSITKVVEFLKKDGFQVQKIALPDCSAWLENMLRIYDMDGNFDSFIDTELHGVEVESLYAQNIESYKMPNLMKRILSKYEGYFGSKMLEMIIRSGVTETSETMLGVRGKQISDTRDFINILKKDEISLIICPGYGVPAPKLGDTPSSIAAFFFVGLWNYLECPAGMIPIRKLEKDDTFNSTFGEDVLTRALQETCKGTAGLPTGVQIISHPWGDEKVVALMQYIQEGLHLAPFCKF